MPIECYRLTIEGISTGNHCQNDLHFNVDNNDDVTPIELAEELVNLWNANCKADWLGFNSNRYGLRWIQAKRILPNGGNSFWKEFPEGTDIGTIDEEQGAVSLAPIVKMYSGLTAGLQGRVFLPAPPTGAIADNQFDSSYLTAVDEWITANLTFVGDHEWTWAIYSRKNNLGSSVSTAHVGPIFGQIGRRRQPL